MSAARALGTIYLLMASIFGVAIALHQHPLWGETATESGLAATRFADAHFVRPAAAAGIREIKLFFDKIDPEVGVVRTAVVDRVRRMEARRHIAWQVLRRPLRQERVPALRPEIVDDVRPNKLSPRLVLAAPPAKPALRTPAESPATSDLEGNSPAPNIAPAELTRVVERLRDNLTPELLANFDLFLYVSKAEHGPWAQHMYVFAKSQSGDLNLRYNWLVSTGREQIEVNDAGRRLTTNTPPGYYELDPNRLYRHYHSGEWDKPMPYAMFFDWQKHGRKTGLALHAATGEDVALLGQRASAGCIHLAPKDAAILFSLIRGQYRGLAPRFAIDRRTGTMSTDGILVHDANGKVQLAEGYKVLIFIENYGGENNVVAALY